VNSCFFPHPVYSFKHLPLRHPWLRRKGVVLFFIYRGNRPNHFPFFLPRPFLYSFVDVKKHPRLRRCAAPSEIAVLRSVPPPHNIPPKVLRCIEKIILRQMDTFSDVMFSWILFLTPYLPSKILLLLNFSKSIPPSPCTRKD